MQTLIKVSNRIKWYYIKLTSPVSSFKKWFLADITQTFTELNNSLDNRLDNLESKTDVEDVENRVENLEYYDLDDIQERAENAERKAEDNENKLGELGDNIVDIEGDIKTIKKVDFAGIADRFDKLDERVNNREDKQPEPLLKGQEYFQEYDGGKQERREQSLSDIQRLTFEICSYYGGGFDVNDFDNCYEIINKYDINLNNKGGQNVK